MKLWRGVMMVVLAFTAQWVAAKEFSKSYALVVGVSDYPSAGLPALPNAGNDADNMERYLLQQGYQVKKLVGQEATRDAIVGYLVDDLAPRIGKDDRFLFYFSGHGVTRQVGGKDRGYIVPRDGRKTSAASWISMSALRDSADLLGSARHQLFVFDSCFGGAFAVKSLASSVSPSALNYIQRITAAPARQYITAGGANEQVSAASRDGMSLFTYQLLQGLGGEADTNTDGYITVSEIAAYMQTAGSTLHSTPVAGNFRGHGNGDFLFASPLQASINHNNNIGGSGGTKNLDQPVPGYVEDPNGKRYATIELNEKIWLQSNLDYRVQNSWCYENKFRNCTDYGRLYTWQAAQQACQALGQGWRLPSDADWRNLADQFGGYNNAQQERRDTRATQQALSPNGSSGFNLQFGGGRYGNEFGYINAHGKYWSATLDSEDAAWYMAFVGQVERYPDPIDYGYSVRCIKG